MAEERHNTIKRIKQAIKIYQSFLTKEMFQEGNHLIPESEIENYIKELKNFLQADVGLTQIEIGCHILMKVPYWKVLKKWFQVLTKTCHLKKFSIQHLNIAIQSLETSIDNVEKNLKKREKVEEGIKAIE